MTDTAEQSVESTLADDIEKAFQELEARDDENEETGKQPESQPDESIDEEDSDESDKDESDKDESDKSDKPEESSDLEEEDLEEEDLEEKLEPPQHWKTEDREAFSKAPKDIQEWALRRDKEREADYTRKTQDLAETRKFKEQVDSLIEPYRPAFSMQGLDDVGAIRFLVGWKQYLDNNPAEAITALARDYGVEFTKEPDVELPPEVAQIKRDLDQMKAHEAQRARQAQQEQQTSLQSQIESFRSAKDETGNSKHPHFDTVRADMAALVSAGRASGLDDAYEKAVRLHPDIYDAQIIEQRKKIEAEERKKQEDEKKAKAAKAKKAASGVKSGSASVKDSPKTLKQELQSVWEQLESQNH